ncbi:hypothetical protein M885DRAFT_517199 [Pelagophyceae sp. CCMP2097]|nr:hypothetical protein M885DRAFT_517199 [Pelagophyceae sp. CCMP2097]|mmetsp:Transcript_20161/g.68288  ORF Transcript_20161/g.68288 Transcript_20161/m.68288 type:complete len:152 (-) Transcript_20161:306-761(-)
MRASARCALVALFLGAGTDALQPLKGSPTTAKDKGFVNPNPVAQTMIETAQLKEGKRVVFGVMTEEVGPVDMSSAAVAARSTLRASAAASLTNIDDDERARRANVAAVLGVVTLALAAYFVQAHAGALERLAVLPFVALSLGYYESAREGL